MNPIALSSCLALALCGGATSWTLAAPPPVPGPGGVAVAVRELLAAQDAGADVASLLGDGPYAIDLSFDGDGELGDFAGGVPVFFDVARNGAPLTAKTPAEFAAALAADARSGGAMHSVLGGLRATCQSPECSWAVFAFERVRTVDGHELREPMRGSALLSFDEHAKHHFRIHQWHVSRGPVVDVKR
ncbi:MAG: hypothetical protein U1F36_10375 [Planctomycetota bacterium]